MPKRTVNFLDKIGGLIPGFRNYSKRQDTRIQERLDRKRISLKLEEIENRFEKIKIQLIEKHDFKKVIDIESTRKEINTIKSKIKYAEYGSSSLFSEYQISDIEMQELENYNRIIKETTHHLSGMINDKDITTDSLNQIRNTLIEISIAVNSRNDFIQKFK